MVKFGPSGCCDRFLSDHKSVEDIPEWLEAQGLDSFEYAFNKGIFLSDEKASQYREIFEKHGIELTVHGPYFINFANPDDMMAEKSYGYIIKSLQKMRLMGAKKLVFHPGSLTKQTREKAFEVTMDRLKTLVGILDEYGFDDMFICPETMGKHGQIGTVEEVAQMCALDPRIMPTLDFGHINSFTGGTLKTKDDYIEVFKTLEKYIGDRYKNVHIHFSKIMYGPKGELKHLTFEEDNEYGPDFEPLAEALKELGVNATVICESRGSQTDDAIQMKQIFETKI
ncbi:MAG: TIM barrel protein [Clostridia bacterium]|nr:TIM barrel protein [Clostridia bacterium]